MALGQACDVGDDKPELTPREVYRRLKEIVNTYENHDDCSRLLIDLLDDIGAWTLATEGRKSEVESLYATNAELLSRLNQLTAEPAALKLSCAGPLIYDVFAAVPPGGTLVYEAPGDDV